MARSLYRLTPPDVKNARPGDIKEDGGGLRFECTALGRGKWVFRYTSPANRKRRERGCGAYPGVTLKTARKQADAWRDDVRAGRDPIVVAKLEAAKQRAAVEVSSREERRRAATVEACARDLHRRINGEFRNRKHAAQWIASLEGSLPDRIWKKPVADVQPGELLDALLELRDRVPETAKRVRQRLEATFADAALRGLCDRNPASLVHRAMRSKRKGEAVHFRALHYRDVPGFVQALRAYERVGMAVKLAIEFAILCASRSGEVRGARWSEIDRKARLWIIPGERMKGGEAHRVHLPPRALEILEEVAPLRTDQSENALVFPAPRDKGRPLSDMALTAALRRLQTGRTREDGEPETFGDVTTMHGLARSTFSTWANSERVASSEIIEAALAHREGDRVKAAYDRSAKEGERFERDLRALRLAWADLVCTPKRRAANVLNFPRVAG